MLKYINSQIVFREIPDEITLAINISNCPIRCPDCHSKYLWEDIGNVLDEKSLDILIKDNNGITCVLFMGGDSDIGEILHLARYIRDLYPNLKIAWYSGQEKIPHYIKLNIHNFNYIKTGSYREEFGPLNKKTTNQRLYKIIISPNNQVYEAHKVLEDITYKFWKND